MRTAALSSFGVEVTVATLWEDQLSSRVAHCFPGADTPSE